MIYIYSLDFLIGEEYYSKLLMVDLVGSECFNKVEVNGDCLIELLYINKFLFV